MSMKGPFDWTPRSFDAVPMTKAETIMRREEALKLRWPLIKIIPGAIVPEDPTPIVPGNELRPRYSELLYGGAPGGGMGPNEWPWCLVPQGRQDHHIACAEQVTGGAERCDCGVSPR